MPTLIPTPKIWMNGELVDWDKAQVHVLTHTLHYGTGVFEGIRAYETSKGTAIFRLTEHIERLFRSAHILGMDIPYTVEEQAPGPAQAQAPEHAQDQVNLHVKAHQEDRIHYVRATAHPYRVRQHG